MIGGGAGHVTIVELLEWVRSGERFLLPGGFEIGKVT